MTEPTSRGVEDIGLLRSVVGVCALSPEDRGPGSRFDEYVFGFETRSIVIAAEPLDDTIHVQYGEASLSFPEDLTAREPWRMLIGCGVMWTWTLTNQNGYRDGFQIELARPGECWALQFLSEGGALSVRSIGPVERLWNQFEKDRP
jgi:hypothetical protein